MSNGVQAAGGTPTGSGLAKVLGFRDLVTYGVTYLAPMAPWATFAYVYSLSNGAPALAYLVGFAAMFFTANSYKEICGEVSGPGSVYAYARKAMGSGAGFIGGWMVLLDYILIPALMYVLAAVALNTFLPGIPRWFWVFAFSGFALAVNWFGIAFTARVNEFFMWTQLIAVAIYVVAVLSHTLGGPTPAFPIEAFWNPAMSASGVFGATSICVLAFLGFDAITTLNEEVRPDQKHLIGRSIMVCLVIVGSIFVVQVWIMTGLATGYKFTDLASGGYDMTSAKVSPVAGVLMAWFASIIAGIALPPPMVVGATRVLYAMSAGGQLPKALSVVDPKHAIPQRALLVVSAISITVALVMIGMPDDLTSTVNFGALSAYAFVNLSVITLLGFKRRTGRWIAHIVMPLIGMGIIAAVVTQMSPLALKLGIGWLIAGILYYAWLKRFRPAATVAPIAPL
jgi:amino acid transporter